MCAERACRKRSAGASIADARGSRATLYCRPRSLPPMQPAPGRPRADQRMAGRRRLVAYASPVPCRPHTCAGVGGRRSTTSHGCGRRRCVAGWHLASLAGWSSQEARRVHTAEVAGSNPAPATHGSEQRASRRRPDPTLSPAVRAMRVGVVDGARCPSRTGARHARTASQAPLCSQPSPPCTVRGRPGHAVAPTRSDAPEGVPDRRRRGRRPDGRAVPRGHQAMVGQAAAVSDGCCVPADGLGTAAWLCSPMGPVGAVRRHEGVGGVPSAGEAAWSHPGIADSLGWTIDPEVVGPAPTTAPGTSKPAGKKRDRSRDPRLTVVRDAEAS
jgi:hypothetical protein